MTKLSPKLIYNLLSMELRDRNRRYCDACVSKAKLEAERKERVRLREDEIGPDFQASEMDRRIDSATDMVTRWKAPVDELTAAIDWYVIRFMEQADVYSAEWRKI